MSKAYLKLLEYLLNRTHEMMLSRPGMNHKEIEVARFHKDLLLATKDQSLWKNHLKKAKQLEKEHVAMKKTTCRSSTPRLMRVSATV